MTQFSIEVGKPQAFPCMDMTSGKLLRCANLLGKSSCCQACNGHSRTAKWQGWGGRALLTAAGPSPPDLHCQRSGNGFYVVGTVSLLLEGKINLPTDAPAARFKRFIALSFSYAAQE